MNERSVAGSIGGLDLDIGFDDFKARGKGRIPVAARLAPLKIVTKSRLAISPD